MIFKGEIYTYLHNFQGHLPKKDPFFMPKILAVTMSFSVPEMSVLEDKIRFKELRSRDVQCQI